MNKEKLTVLIILIIFSVGMTMGSLTATHTYHEGKYTFTLSNEDYSNLKNHKLKHTTVKTNNYKTINVPKYKNKKVNKYKWKSETVKAWDDIYKFIDNDTVSVMHYEYRIPSKYTSGWKFVDEYSKVKNNKETGYYIFKKKVKYTTTKKVKDGYKKEKFPINAEISVTADDNWNVNYYLGDSNHAGFYKSLGTYSFNP